MADRVLVAGAAAGPVLALDEPLSFWGGLDASTGRVSDRHHPQVGETITGRILVMETGRGSSSGSNGLAEAIRRGTGPAAIVMLVPDEIVVIGALVAEELYRVTVPVVTVDEPTFESLRRAGRASVGFDGRIDVI